MRLLLPVSVLLAAVLVAGCASSPGCILGTAQACACPGGGAGAQVCVAGGTFGACDCGSAPDGGGFDAGLADDAPQADGGAGTDDAPGADGGAGLDAGSVCPSGLTPCSDRCVDTSTDEENCGGCADATHTCAAGSYCIDAACVPVGACPPPFVVCGGECIDPSSNRTHCGASGDCSGANAGATCGGVCEAGECVFDSCSDALARGETTDGLYLVDVDGTGPIPPRDAYCDMTTAGGGWTLVYRIRNDIPDIADPWWPMVGLGSGDALPTSPTPLPSGTHFEGPTRQVRADFGYRIPAASGVDIRLTQLEASGATRFDGWTTQSDVLGFPALGRMGAPTQPSSGPCITLIPPSTWASVIAAAPTLPVTVGSPFGTCFQNSTADAFLVSGTPGGPTAAVCGDETAGATTTTLFWTRSHPSP